MGQGVYIVLPDSSPS